MPRTSRHGKPEQERDTRVSRSPSSSRSEKDKVGPVKGSASKDPSKDPPKSVLRSPKKDKKDGTEPA